MSGMNIIFNDEKIKQSNFYKNKKISTIDDIDVKKEPYGKKSSFKYFSGYNDNDIIKPLFIKLPQMIGYVKCFDSNQAMFFKVTDKKLLKNYTKILGKVINLINIKFDNEPVYGGNDKYRKTTMKIYRDKVNTNFQSKKYQKKCIIQAFIIANARFYYQSK